MIKKADNLKKLLQLAKSVETDLQNKTITCIHIQKRKEKKTCIYKILETMYIVDM